MNPKEVAELKALSAAREYGIGTIFFRNTLAKRIGVNLTESLCLTILGIRGSSTPGELARFTGLTSGAATAMLDRLEKRRFVRRRPNPSDRRGIIVEIDEGYAAAAAGLVDGIRTANAEVAARYSCAELEVIADFLTRMTECMAQESRRMDAVAAGEGESV